MIKTRKLLFGLCFISTFLLQAQTNETVDSMALNLDTTIYQVVSEMPRFPGCEQLDTTIQFINECSQKSLLSFIYQNVQYPLEARQNGQEGTVVVRFIVESNGVVSSPTIVRDIGGGCGAEVLRLIHGMTAVGIKWRPGYQGGKAVRVAFTLPVKFKLEEAPPYVIIDRDTVYTQLDTPLEFVGAHTDFETYLNNTIVYPSMGNDSCAIGHLDLQILVEPDARVRVLELNDFSSLGLDFQLATISAVTKTIGQWKVATYQNRSVPTSYQLRHTFIPTDTEKCAAKIKQFEQANALADEGTKLFNQGEQEAGIAKMSQAIALFPDNADFRYVRGEAYLNMSKMAEACEDLTKVQDVLLVSWYKDILPFICK